MPERGEVGVINKAVISGLDIVLPLKGLSLDKVFPDVFLHLLLSSPAVPGEVRQRLISARRPSLVPELT